MMEQKKISCDSVYDRLPPLSPKYPWFVAQNLEDKEIRDQIFYTTHKPLYQYRCRVPELVGRQIRAFFHGWVILSNHPHDLIWSLWNPLTSKIIHLPLLQGDYHECCLSSPPDDPSSLFLLTAIGKPIIMVCQLACETKNVRWIEISYANQLRSIIDEEGLLHNLTCCNGKVYALHSGNECDFFVIHVDIIMVKEDKVVIRLLPFLGIPNPSFRINHSFGRRLSDGCFSFDRVDFLKGSSTELFYVEIGFEDEMRKTVGEVYLFKLDMTSMMWEEMEELKDAVFFIEFPNDYSIFYASRTATEFGGYIHILDVMGEILYSYHLKDRTISASSMSSLAGTSKLSSWAMLEFRLEGDYGEAKGATHSKQEETTEEKKTLVRLDSVNEVKSNESHLLDLPFHVLETIMEFCVGIEYMNFRATCKRCHLAAPSIQWSKKTALTRLQTYSLASPWLIVIEKHQMTFTDPIFGNRYFIKTPQKLITGNWRIHCSRYGWLLMSKGAMSLMFFNPFTSDIRELLQAPRLESCCFTAPPSSPDCMVVGLINLFDWEVYIHFVVREPNDPRIIRLNVGGGDPYCFCFPTYHGGSLCALSNEGKLYVYEDFNEEPLIIDTPSSSCKSTKQYFQVKCDQNLLLVVVGKFGESVEVFKLSDVTKGWEKIDDLGNHAIYISDSICLCIEAKTPGMKNKIYFPRLHSENRDMVLYSLETRMYHTFIGKNIKESLGDLFGTTYHCYSHAWIEPSWS